MFAAYGTLPVYEAFFRGLGWGEAIDPMVEAWRAGDRKLALERVPEELIREIILNDQSHEGAAARLRRAGDHDARADPDRRADQIDELAP